MTPEAINDFANYLAVAALVMFVEVGIVYAIGPKGERFAPLRSNVGRVQVAVFASVVAVLSIVVLRRTFGDYPGYEWVAVTGYTVLTITGIALAILIPTERKAAPMTTIETPTFLRQSRKALVAGGVAAATTLGTGIVAVTADGKVETAECIVLGGAAIAAFFAGFAATWATTNAPKPDVDDDPNAY